MRLWIVRQNSGVWSKTSKCNAQVVVDANDFFLVRAKIFRTSLESNQDGVGVT